MSALPEGWTREDRNGGRRTWFQAPEHLEGIEVEVTARGVMLHGLTEYQLDYSELLALRDALAAAAARHLELRGVVPEGGDSCAT